MIKAGKVVFSKMPFKRNCLIAALFLLNTVNYGFSAELSRTVVSDKIKGGWVGQMVGVTWGDVTEFLYNNVLMPDNNVPQWTSDKINNGFTQDDIYVEIPFIQTMIANGVNCNWSKFGNTFAGTQFSLWHANLRGRNNLKAGIPVPLSGHYKNNNEYDDIDYQIEADYAGIIAPGMPNTAAEIAWRGGHLMNWANGVYGGVFVAAMHARAYTATDINQIIEAGRQAIPSGTRFRTMIEDCITQKSSGKTFDQAWKFVTDTYSRTNKAITGDPGDGGVSDCDYIDVCQNAGYILIALLYGNGDFELTIRLAMRAGADSDCNPASVGGILGNYFGFSNLPSKFTQSLNYSTKFSYTEYSIQNCINLSEQIACSTLVMSGGTISGTGSSEKWTIPDQTIIPITYEQCEIRKNSLGLADPRLFIENTAPSLTASAGTPSSNSVAFTASATDQDGIKEYTWYFGDLSFTHSQNPTHTYKSTGEYPVICYVTDSKGYTSNKEMTVSIGQPAVRNLASSGTIIATVTSPLGDGSKNIEVIRDGVKPTVGSTDAALQYDTYDNNQGTSQEYYGYTFSSQKTFTKVVFQEGKHFWDGGWFKDGSLKIQVRKGGTWTDVAKTVSPAYPVGNIQTAFGSSFEMYEFSINETGDGVRIIGDVGGNAQFVSISELEVWGSDPGNSTKIVKPNLFQQTLSADLNDSKMFDLKGRIIPHLRNNQHRSSHLIISGPSF